MEQKILAFACALDAGLSEGLKISGVHSNLVGTLLYKVPSKSTGKNFVTNVYILLSPEEFIMKCFFKVFDS